MTGTRGLRRFAAPPPGGQPGDAGSGTASRGLPPGTGPAQVAADPRDAAVMPASGQAAPAAVAPAMDGAAGPAERCELCSEGLPAGHGHIADLENSSLACACRACYLLFALPSAGRGRYRAVPDRYVTDPGSPLSSAEFDELEIPVGLAFFIEGSRAGRVAGFYPSPAGVTECVLNLAGWARMAARHPLLGAAEPDVEAVLISASAAGTESFVVPVDACYELAGRMRLQWRGFDGGPQARSSIDGFLAGIRRRAQPLTGGGGA